MFTSMNEVLGLAQMAANELLDEEIDALIVERNEARQQKNWGELMKFAIYYQSKAYYWKTPRKDCAGAGSEEITWIQHCSLFRLQSTWTYASPCTGLHR